MNIVVGVVAGVYEYIKGFAGSHTSRITIIKINSPINEAIPEKFTSTGSYATAPHSHEQMRQNGDEAQVLRGSSVLNIIFYPRS